MFDPHAIALLTLFATLVVGVPALVAFAISRIPRIGIASSFLFLGFYAHSAYFAVWPEPTFYIDEFEDFTGIRLPAGTRVVARDSSYPDFHGDYFSTALFTVPHSEMNLVGLKLRGETECSARGTIDFELIGDVAADRCGWYDLDDDQYFEWEIYLSDAHIYYFFSQT